MSGTNDIVVLGQSAPQGWPAGWLLQHEDSPVSRKSNETCWRGPVSSLAGAFEKACAAKPGCKISVSRSPGSAVAEIRATFGPSGSVGDDGEGGQIADYDTLKIAPDTWRLAPVLSPVDISAHSAFSSISGEGGAIDAMKDALARGETAAARAAAGSDSAALAWLGLWLAGRRTFDAVAMSYRYVNHLSVDDAATTVKAVKEQVKDALESVLQVFEWDDVEGTDDAPFPEPKWIDAGNSNAKTSYEWRLDGVEISYSQNELTVAWAYTGLWKWAKILYDGGTWEPEAQSGVS